MITCSLYWRRPRLYKTLCETTVVVLVKASIAVIKTAWLKATWGGKVVFRFHFHIKVHCFRQSGQVLKQVRNVKDRADRVVTKRVMLTNLLILLTAHKTTNSEVPFSSIGRVFPHQSLAKTAPTPDIAWRARTKKLDSQVTHGRTK